VILAVTYTLLQSWVLEDQAAIEPGVAPPAPR
jgi:hypothetical protein